MEHWGIVPDLVTQAKSLAAGMPLSAVTGRKEIMDLPHVGGLGGTYGGNPVSCRAALAVLEILFEDGLLERSRKLGETLQGRFAELQKRHEIIGEVRGKGPMLALELVRDRETKEPATEEAKRLTRLCYDRGLVLLSCGNFGNVIRTLMPFVITDEQLDKGLEILEDGLKELTR
jgi:4-aminobutyrate aminotransferase/(S)-3-amino-2-methylpropionate transaminase